MLLRYHAGGWLFLAADLRAHFTHETQCGLRDGRPQAPHGEDVRSETALVLRAAAADLFNDNSKRRSGVTSPSVVALPSPCKQPSQTHSELPLESKVGFEPVPALASA